MDEQRIKQKMHELETKIAYRFNDIRRLAEAMKAQKLDVKGGKNHSEYTNEALATVGDAVLKAILADHLYKDRDIKTKAGITDKKSKLESNDVMCRIMSETGLIDYAYNDKHFHSEPDIPDHEKVVDKGHDSYLEALIGAVYYDSSYCMTKKWVLDWLLPLLEKYKKVE